MPVGQLSSHENTIYRVFPESLVIDHRTINIVQTVNALGQRCPMPLLMAKRALRELASGDVLEVIADDPGSTKAFDAFARLAGHGVSSQTGTEGTLIHLITKA